MAPAAAPPTPEAPPPQEPPQDDLLRRLSDAAWRLLVLVAAIALLLWGMAYIGVVVIPVIFAVFLTALLMPLANWLRRKGLGRGSSTSISVIFGLVVVGGAITLVVQPAIAGVSDLVDSVSQALTQLEGVAAAVGLDTPTLNQLTDQLWAEVQNNSSQLVSGAWAGALVVGEVLVAVVLSLVLTVYFVHSGDQLAQWMIELFPRGTRRALNAAGRLTYDVMGRYVRGVALVGLFDAVFIGIVLLIVLDTNLAIPLIVLTFIGAFLPVVGAFASGLLSTLVAFVAEGWIIALVVLGAVVLVQQLESHLFAPRVYGKALDLPSAVVLLAIAIGSIIGGIIGTFLATPIAAVVAALLRNRPFGAVQAEEQVEQQEARPAAGGAPAEGRPVAPARGGARPAVEGTAARPAPPADGAEPARDNGRPAGNGERGA
ncbi:AI-2E family transporter [Marinactinospora rubrisoli]|uniref:AI-2E family transporter n=1 Tax=Marinactinospora rubrisoli TaxID=2715399 RepID=A0ABW2KB84_9ACTN